MANWARLQEQLTGLTVVKRSRNSIHFDKGNGEIVANFSGAPCHYEENGEWKALDTAIKTLEDGSLGAKGVPVRLNLNGLVRLINENNEDLYSQVTTRVGVFNSTTRNLVDYINLPVGQVQDDQLVKDTDLYSHTLRLTETGLREEIVIKTKPSFITDKANLWLVLDTVVTGITFENGWLDQFEIAQMHFPPPTATDAEGREGTAKRYAKQINGVQHIFTGLKFSELYRAAYPVTIDPDFSVNTGSGGDTTLNTAIPTSSRGSSTTIQVSTGATQRKGLIRFDLSSIAAGSITTAAALKLTSGGIYVATVSYNIYKISDANGDWIEGTSSSTPAPSGEPCWNAKVADGSAGVTTAWAGSAGLSTAGTDFIDTILATYDNTSGNYDLAINTQYDWDFNSSGLTVINSYFGQATNNGFLFTQTGTVQTSFHSVEATTESYRPVLTVTYTAAGGVPKQYLHYARLRSN